LERKKLAHVTYVLFILKIEGIFGKEKASSKCWKG